MKHTNKIWIIGVIALLAFIVLNDGPEDQPASASIDPVPPNWAAISAWPGVSADQVEAQPDPKRRMTAIILDDSGSMRGDIIPAKAAVVRALDAMAEEDRVAVLALNAGVVTPFTSVSEARTILPELLEPIGSEGSTPLTRAIIEAQDLLEVEASRVRGFGTFRLIVTTDGQADDDQTLQAAIETLASSTPIQMTTIGIGITGGHVLRRNDLGSFVDVSNVEALEDALETAIAENADFTAITDFSAGEG